MDAMTSKGRTGSEQRVLFVLLLTLFYYILKKELIIIKKVEIF